MKNAVLVADWQDARANRRTRKVTHFELYHYQHNGTDSFVLSTYVGYGLDVHQVKSEDWDLYHAVIRFANHKGWRTKVFSIRVNTAGIKGQTTRFTFTRPE